MLDKKEAISILANSSFTGNGGQDKADSISLALARASKHERRQHIKGNDDSLEKVLSAIIEISRIWRGYHCRQNLRKKFSDLDRRIQPKPPPAPPVQHVQEEEEKPLIVPPSETSDVNISPEKDIVSVVEEMSEVSVPPEPVIEEEKPKKPVKVISTKSDAAVIIQRAWRRHIDMQVFRYYRDLINFRGQGDPGLMLRCINPNEAKLLDAAAGIHVRFRLAGEKFPPNIYYKIYTHRPIIDMCANSPKDYTKPSAKTATAKQVHNKNCRLYNNKDGWYARHENNRWRLVSDRLIYSSMDPVTWESSRKKVEFHHVKLQRKADVENRRRQRKIQWMKKMHKEGMLKAKEADQETKELVEKAALGLVNTVNVQGPDAVMDWEVDELLQWTTALNFDDYLEIWKETATSNVSECEVSFIKHSALSLSPEEQSRGAIAVNFDPYGLTRSSSIGVTQSQHRGIPMPSGSTQRAIESRAINSEETLPRTGENLRAEGRQISEESLFKVGRESNKMVESVAR